MGEEGDSNLAANRIGFWRGCLLFVVLLFLVVAGCFRFSEYRRQYARVPMGLDVAGISYSKEESWGIGMPGDNETGIIVYRLDDKVAKVLETGGLKAINELGKQGSDAWTMDDARRKRLYDEWIATPYTLRECASVRQGDDWVVDAKTCRYFPTLGAYLDRYGFGIEVDQTVRRDVDKALSTSGSYYSHSRSGIFLIAPSLQKAVFFYAG